MNKNAVVILLVFALLLYGCTGGGGQPSQQQPPAQQPSTNQSPSLIGVKVGDWVEYSVNVTGINEHTELAKIEIMGIGKKVALNITHYYTNGSNETDTTAVDVSTEAGDVTAANLNIGDSRIYPPETVTVSEILTRNYSGVSREVVHLSQNTFGRSLDLYYDRKTGFLVEEHYHVTGSFAIDIEFHSTNLW